MDIQAIMENNKIIFDKLLPEMLPKVEDGQEKVVEAMGYSLANGGKRIRPLLVMEFAKACGNTGSKYDDALPFACAVEMVHTYSLIHDDLPCMDDDDMRRGKPSCHKQFDEATALLAGDALLTTAFQIIADAQEHNDLPASVALKMVSVLALNAGVNGMIGGQVMDLKYENTLAGLEQVTKVYLLKTSALIEAACLLGCYAGGGSSEMQSAASVYAKKLGLAFQIQDDILDITGDITKLGKPIGSDQQNHKSTYVSLLGLEKAKSFVKELTEEAVAALTAFPDEQEELTAIAYALIDREN